MHYPPPEIFIQCQGGRVIKREQPEYGQTNQAGNQHHIDHGFPAAQNGHQDIKNKSDDYYSNTDFGDGWLLQKFPAHGRQKIVAGNFGERSVRHGQVTNNG